MSGFIIFSILVVFLWLSRSIIIPFLVAVFLWYLINAIATYYRKIMPHDTQNNIFGYIERHHIFDWLSKILATFTLGMIIYLFVFQIKPMFSELLTALPHIQEKLVTLGNYASNSLGLTFDSNVLPNINKIATNIGSSIASIVASLGMILVYILFMFIEQSTFDKKFASLFCKKPQYKKVSFIINSIDRNMKKYIFVKTFISTISAIFSYIWLQILGVEFAGVWAFIVFATSYIPTIGAIIACGLPILYSLAMTGDFHQPLLVACGLIGVQILFGNIIEPKFTGKTLNMSTLAILINLVFWGMIWGIAGMFFSVPLLVATFVITAQFDSTRWIAVLLSADGNIPDKNDD